MLRQCVTLAVLGCVLAVPAPQHQYQPQHQQAGGYDPHLLRQYLADQQAAAPAPAQTQVLQRPQHLQQAAPRPAQPLYTVQSEAQYQPQQHQQQYQPQPQPQPQYRPQPQYQAQRPQEQREPEEYDPHPSYQFGFDVNDDQYTNYQNRKEQRDGDVIKGSYSVVDSDGFVRTVTYTADPKEGFKAEVSRQPTDIVVKIPTPKPQLLQPQVQHAAHAQPRPQQPQHAAPQQYYRYEQ
ncbi:cuticle protein 7 isoform X1 [Helicoverpa armigera]|uniref:cuticle protein 7 isoform X1 n=1 Tax=Helicoverpa armigera TaxID=29058 RepID=UPI001F5A8DDD|nr:cuticle protein 7 isoform X1 [Helicoverpa armigera]XP_047020391.1 cuticle protein 7 isoform X1 [Helicoverpa zea]